MARVEIPEVILGDTGSGMTPVTASVQVNYRNGGEATVYISEFSETETTNPLSVSDINGRVEGWVEAGSYDLVVTTESDLYTQRFEASPGVGVGGELNIKSFGAVASTSDDDLVNAEAIQAAIGALPPGGGTILIPNETFGVSSLIPITFGNRHVIFKGEGPGSQLLNVNESFTSELSMFSISGTTGSVRFVDLKIVGPTAIGVAGGFHVVNLEDGFVSISFQNCTVQNFNRIVNGDVATNWIGLIDFDRCSLTGYNSTGVSYSTFVYLASPGTGTRLKKVRVRNCFLSGFGSVSDGTVYGISVPSDCDLDVYGNEWYSGANTSSGACIAVGHDTTVLAANSSTAQFIHDNHFDAGIIASPVKVMGVANPRIYNNDFANTTPSVYVASDTPNVEVFGNKFHGATGFGAVLNTSDGTLRVFRNSFDLTGSGKAVVNAAGTLASLEVFDNDFAATAVPVTLTATPTVYREWGNHGALYDTLLTAASATALVLPTTGEVISVTGTTTITSMTVRQAGKRIVLVFAGVLTFTDGSNLKLAGDMVTSADDTIELISNGTNWYELGRSAN